MQYQIKSDDKSVDLIGKSYKLHFTLNDSQTMGLEVYNDGLLMGKTRYFGKIILKPEGAMPPVSGTDAIEGKNVEMIASRARVINDCPENPYIEIELTHPKAKGYIQFFPVDGNNIDINVKVSVTYPKTSNMGFVMFCLDCQTPS